MTKEDFEKRMAALRELRKKVQSSEEVAKTLLMKSGIYTKKGALKKEYR